jgi:membrane-associated phospholipid phosphatase
VIEIRSRIRSLRLPLLVSGLLVLLVIGLHFYLEWVGLFPGDLWAMRQGWHNEPTVVNGYANLFQYLGTPGLAIALVVVTLAILLRHRLYEEAVGLLIACVAVALNALLKLVLGPSPLWILVHYPGHNFPSGHVTFVTAVIGYIGVVAWRHRRRWISAIAVVLIIAVGPSRVVTGIHLVSDVVGGYILGTAMLLLAVSVATQRSPSRATVRLSEDHGFSRSTSVRSRASSIS